MKVCERMSAGVMQLLDLGLALSVETNGFWLIQDET